MSTSAERVRRKRERAREQGFCVTCCVRQPRSGLHVCESCKSAVQIRKKAHRARLRQRGDLHKIVSAHERAGDNAQSYHFYEDAAQHYQEALDVEGIISTESARISEKLANAISSGRTPAKADPIFDRVLSYITDSSDAEKIVEILLLKARQFWLDARTESALLSVSQAIRVAQKTPQLSKLTRGIMSNYLGKLGRYQEAEKFLDEICNISSEDPPNVRRIYHVQRGICWAIAGNKTESFRHFERALVAAKEEKSTEYIVGVWENYAVRALWFGELETAKMLCEKVLFAVRRWHMVWYTAWACLNYADILFMAGQYEMAHEYVIEAISYDAEAPVLDASFSAVGIPILLHVNDTAALAKCTRGSAIDFAFRSGEPDGISSIVAAFTRWHVSRGNIEAARKLLHRALGTPSIDQARQPILAIATARYGLLSDIPRARQLLQGHIAFELLLPCRQLFDAFVEERRGRRSEASRYAIEAIQRFTELGCHGYADLARPLLHPLSKSSFEVNVKPQAETLSMLTPREQQVAKLVLKGFTNREIAKALSIKERTVLLADTVTHPGTIAHDIAASVIPGVERAIALGIADRNRLGIMGGSFGGFSTMAVITQTHMFKAAVADKAPENWTSVYGVMQEDGSEYNTQLVETGQGKMGGTLWEHLDRYIANSPVFSLDKITTPSHLSTAR